jgi:hypothetical protein
VRTSSQLIGVLLIRIGQTKEALVFVMARLAPDLAFLAPAPNKRAAAL